MPWIERDGRTVDEARIAALAAIGLPEDQVELEIVHEGARGLFGLGGEPAVVRARPRSEAKDFRSAFEVPGPVPASVRDSAEPEPQELEDVVPPAPITSPASAGPDGAQATEREELTAQVGREMVEGILHRMELQGEVVTRVAGGTVYVEISGENMGILIGRGGATLEALQELVRAGVQRRLKARGSVVVDVESYWDRRRSRGARQDPSPRGRQNRRPRREKGS